MNYQEFRSKFYAVGAFSTNQVYSWRPEFDKNALGRWVSKKLLIKLRNGYYAFPEYLNQPDFALYIANRIYRPSYISLHSALAFYGMIPEAITQITSVTSLKTNTFTNDFGTYSYKLIRNDLFFGFDLKPYLNDRSILLAKPEKALLDLLYLYPFYSSKEDMEDLRLDEYYMQEELNVPLLKEYTEKYSKAVEMRTKLLLKTYGL